MEYPKFFSIYNGYKIYAQQHGSCYFKVHGFENIFLSVHSAEQFIDKLLEIKIKPLITNQPPGANV